MSGDCNSGSVTLATCNAPTPDASGNTSIPICLQVLYSSIAALLGSPGQAAYAAANSELDALAACWHRSGIPVTSVQWGGWAGAGMAASRITQASTKPSALLFTCTKTARFFAAPPEQE